ncbi:hypothetical protein [Olegusella massiliensis]|uniref:hypothetical protein n=1 Tax=Olegusella massiliensis TaxID=1776381 RepID=UPI000AE16F9E|nr:hypothetical protein [Olegusella massiliensis]
MGNTTKRKSLQELLALLSSGDPSDALTAVVFSLGQKEFSPELKNPIAKLTSYKKPTFFGAPLGEFAKLYLETAGYEKHQKISSLTRGYEKIIGTF